MRQFENFAEKGIVVNLSEMVPANEVPRPYNEMILNDDPTLLKPLIKYGVNPASGIPLSDDFMATVVHAVGSADCNPTGNEDPVIVGERRKLLVDLFFVRADMLFTNMINTLNVQYDKELRYRFRDIYNKLSLMEYCPWDDDNKTIVALFDRSLLSREQHSMLLYNPNIDVNNRNRLRMSKLVDLEYYMRVPLGTILDGILSPIAADYNNSVSRVNSVLMTSDGLGIMAIDYDEYIQFLGVCYANLIACTETIVRLLYDEAMDMLRSGYIGQYGIEYDEIMGMARSAALSVESKIIKEGAEKDLKSINL